MRIQEIEAKTILVSSRLPDTDYVVNPFTGCAFGCQYCYASFMGRFVGEPFDSWGDYVYVKTNAVELLKQELSRWDETRRRRSLLLSSVTDPYQGLESRYKLTRGLLTVLADEQYPGCVSMLTKSPLVLRDVDILKRLPQVEVGITVTTTDDRLSRFLEVRAPAPSRRIETLTTLNREGIRTYAFLGPLLPHFRMAPARLRQLVESVAATGVRSVYVEHINLKPYIREHLFKALKAESVEVRGAYAAAATQEHRDELDALLKPLLTEFGLDLRLGTVLTHASTV